MIRQSERSPDKEVVAIR